MNNKIVAITGASGGLGRTLVRKFWQEGWSVAMIDKNSEQLDAMQQELQTNNSKRTAYNFVVDLSKPHEVYNLLNKPLFHRKQWQCLINNAGISMGGDAYQHNKDEYELWETAMTVNVGAPYILSGGFVVNAKKHNVLGSIINISSMVGLVGAKKPSYATSKAALIGLTKSFAKQVGPLVRVNAICPGAMDTPMIADWDAEKREKVEANIPLGYIADPKEIANIVYFLSTPMASYITGAIINATGGQYLGQ